MTNKILYCATVDYHFKAFHLPYMKWFKEKGWEVDVAASGNIFLPYTDNKYNIPIQRSPLDRSNIVAYKQLKAIIVRNNYDIIHCHTPLGGVLARLAARKARKQGTRIIYTAHGFHFFKGAPLMNWLIYYPIEKLLSRYTDALLTINKEDFNLAKKHRFKAVIIEHIHGVGVDTDQFQPIETTKKEELKKSFGYKKDDFLLFYAAEFNRNKNQQFLLHSMAHLKDKLPNAKLLLAGEGELVENCKRLAKLLGISHMVRFLGFRKDLQEIMPMCDIAVASSFREGLPVNVMEAMSCGLPVIAVNNRGHRELVNNNETGLLINEWDPVLFANKVKKLADSKDLQDKFGRRARKEMEAKYSTIQVLAKKSKLYSHYMKEQEVGEWQVH